MSNPTQQSLANEHGGQNLKREWQWEQIFTHERMGEEVTTDSDSDWAGCKGTRKSSSAGLILLGSHMLKAYTRKKKKHCEEQRRVRIVRSSVGSV